MATCNRDCFNCPYPDCILEELEAEDYAEQRRIEREIVNPKSKRQEKRTAYQRAHYEANREKLTAYRRAYREANREEIAAKQRAYYEANREKLAAYQREYRRKRKEKANDQ